MKIRKAPSMKKFSTFVAAAFMLMLLVSSLTLRADENSAPPEAERFKGKIVLVIIEQSNPLEQRNKTEFLKDAKVETIGGRSFITGTVHLSPRERGDSTQDWRNGASVGIPIAKVGAYYAYSPERFDEVYPALSDNEE
jgi:hypothetical protein